MCEVFNTEFVAADLEYKRLQDLFKDVCWYSFETNCRRWQRPWPETIGFSHVELCGAVYETFIRNGREREAGRFPTYYAGPVRSAPLLPPAVLLDELRDAKRYRDQCLEQSTAPHDWAPGGCKYNELLQVTQVPTEFSKRKLQALEAAVTISKRIQNDV